MYSWTNVDQMLEAATFMPDEQVKFSPTKDLVAPGMVLLVSKAGEQLYHKAFGSRSVYPEITALDKSMTFDVASLTKALITTTLAMKQIEKGQISLDKKLSHVFQTFGTYGKEKITVKHLLNHSSGYAPTLPYYQELRAADKGARAGILASSGAQDFVFNQLFRSELDYEPGSKSVYSDLGFMLLARVIELVSGTSSLEKLVKKEIFSPLELASSGFVDLSALKHHNIEAVEELIVPTLNCPWRKKVLCGEVHDDNAWAMGGVCGHAGLFSTSDDVHRIAFQLLESFKGRSNFVSPDIIKEFWTKGEDVPGSTWALGWDTPSEENSSAGQYFSSDSVGHLAYTGCSLWIDVPREVIVILLTNRIHPDDRNKSIKEFRPLIHDLVMDVLGYS